MMFWTFLSFIYWVALIVFTTILAGKRGRSRLDFFMLSLLASPFIGLIVLFGLSNKEAIEAQAQANARHLAAIVGALANEGRDVSLNPSANHPSPYVKPAQGNDLKNTLLAIAITAAIAGTFVGVHLIGRDADSTRKSEVADKNRLSALSNDTQAEMSSTQHTPLFIRKGAWLCEDKDLLTPNAPPPQGAENCKKFEFTGAQVAVMDVDLPHAYICLPLSTPDIDRIDIRCSNTLLNDVIDANGQPPNIDELAMRAKTTTMADVRSIVQ